jgi:hydrogenase expression/formation protein HypC
MCIAVPGEVVEILDSGRGIVDYGDLRQEIRIDLIDDLAVGEWVQVHAGWAIGRISREKALENLETIREVYDLVYGEA